MTFEELVDFQGFVHLNRISGAPSLRLQARLCLDGHTHVSPGPIVGRRGEDLLNAPTRYTDARYVDLDWEPYLLFVVRDEVGAPIHPKEHYRGRCIRVYERSDLLDENRDALPAIIPPGRSVRHFGLACMNHFVEVLAYGEPTLTDHGMRPYAFGEPGPKG
jgi:hypothetical protein